jgi:hypothetical protein
MAQHNRIKGALGGLEALSQLRLNLVADQTRRASRCQPLAGDSEHTLEELSGGRTAKHVVEARSVRDTARSDMSDRLKDELCAAQLQKRPMPVIMGGRPFEHVHGRALAGERLQRFARLIPVDQEHDSGSEKFEHRIERRLRLGRMGASHQKEGAVFAEPARVFVERAPDDIPSGEQRSQIKALRRFGLDNEARQIRSMPQDLIGCDYDLEHDQHDDNEFQAQ